MYSVEEYIKFELKHAQMSDTWLLFISVEAFSTAEKLKMDFFSTHDKDISVSPVIHHKPTSFGIGITGEVFHNFGAKAFLDHLRVEKTRLHTYIDNEVFIECAQKFLAKEFESDNAIKQYSPQASVDGLTQMLPGLFKVVLHPVYRRHMSVRDVIINLNDSHRWSREAIADWLETLDVDLSFPVEVSDDS